MTITVTVAGVLQWIAIAIIVLWGLHTPGRLLFVAALLYLLFTLDA